MLAKKKGLNTLQKTADFFILLLDWLVASVLMRDIICLSIKELDLKEVTVR